VTYGSCGETSTLSETACIASHGPLPLHADYVDVVAAFCPELLEEYGSVLCCDGEQVLSLGEKLGLASAVAGKCPSCLRNLRQMICNLVCSPDQYMFLNITETVR
jgi:Niemann-Pick C1 protein